MDKKIEDALRAALRVEVQKIMRQLYGKYPVTEEEAETIDGEAEVQRAVALRTELVGVYKKLEAARTVLMTYAGTVRTTSSREWRGKQVDRCAAELNASGALSSDAVQEEFDRLVVQLLARGDRDVPMSKERAEERALQILSDIREQYPDAAYLQPGTLLGGGELYTSRRDLKEMQKRYEELASATSETETSYAELRRTYEDLQVKYNKVVTESSELGAVCRGAAVNIRGIWNAEALIAIADELERAGRKQRGVGRYRIVTAEEVIAMNPCSAYTDDNHRRIRDAHGPDGITIETIAQLDISVSDRIWVLFRVLTDEQKRGVAKMLSPETCDNPVDAYGYLVTAYHDQMNRRAETEESDKQVMLRTVDTVLRYLDEHYAEER